MEYHREERNQIQADIAYRLGMVALQYRERELPPEKDFSVSLDICILQNLLTTCAELIDEMEKHERRQSGLSSEIGTEPLWGLSREMIEVNTFDGRLTVGVVLKRLRNALSHPTKLNLKDTFPSSGYTTEPDLSGKIRKFCLVNSPDVSKSGRAWSHPMWEEAEAKRVRELKHGLPNDVKTIKNEDGKFCFGRDGKPFARIFKIYLTVEEIRTLVIELSNYLAQPIQEQWDGVTIARLVAA